MDTENNELFVFCVLYFVILNNQHRADPVSQERYHAAKNHAPQQIDGSHDEGPGFDRGQIGQIVSSIGEKSEEDPI